MQNASKSPLTAISNESSESSVKRRIETTGDLRRFLSYIATAVAHGDMKLHEAAVAVKACEQINASLYSEIKSAAIQAQAGRAVPALGTLRIDGKNE